jgi:hypothetical protein
LGPGVAGLADCSASRRSDRLTVELDASSAVRFEDGQGQAGSEQSGILGFRKE